jgi:hypothetical protein
MAIEFARMEVVGRSSGGSACRKGAYNSREAILDQYRVSSTTKSAYNSRSKIKDSSGIIHNFKGKDDNVYHKVLLPDYADRKFLDVSNLMNEVERCEMRRNSQLLYEYVLALPDNKEIKLSDREELVLRFVCKKNWVKNGLGVQIDIHRPHNGESNWHAHLLVTTRRFLLDGSGFGEKARDLNPIVRKGFFLDEEDSIGKQFRDIQNEYFLEKGLDIKVDQVSTMPGVHVGPRRMRGIVAKNYIDENIRREHAHLEQMKDGESVLDRVSRNYTMFTIKEIREAVKDCGSSERQEFLIKDVFKSKRLCKLYDIGDDNVSGKNIDISFSGLYTTKEVREEEKSIKRIANKISKFGNQFIADLGSDKVKTKILERINGLEDLNLNQKESLKYLMVEKDSGIRILKGRAGSGKSFILGKVALLLKEFSIYEDRKIIGLAPTNKAKLELQSKGIEDSYTVKGFLFQYKNGRVDTKTIDTVIVDEAGMVGNRDMRELLRVLRQEGVNVIFAGDDRQFESVERGGSFEFLCKEYGCTFLFGQERQKIANLREISHSLANIDVKKSVEILIKEKLVINGKNELDTIDKLINCWIESGYGISDRLIVTVRNNDVYNVNMNIREALKNMGSLGGEFIEISRSGRRKEEYSALDRIVFTATSKEIGVCNSDFGIISRVDVKEGKIWVKLDRQIDSQINNQGANNSNIEIDIRQFKSFKYGYCTTIYKAQGASIKDVYFYHNGAGNYNSTYVGLTRSSYRLRLFNNSRYAIGDYLAQECKVSGRKKWEIFNDLDRIISCSNSHESKEELELDQYFKDKGIRSINNPERLNDGGGKISRLQKQGVGRVIESSGNEVSLDSYIERRLVCELGKRRAGSSSSLDYWSKEEIDSFNIYMNKGVLENGFVGIRRTALYGIVSIKELAMNFFGFFKDRMEDSEYYNYDSRSVLSDKTDENGVKENIYGKLDSQVRKFFGAEAESTLISERIIERKKVVNQKNVEWRDYDQERLIVDLNAKTQSARIANDILGRANESLSSRTQLRYGKKGSRIVNISGNEAGKWYDFESGKGGNIYNLVMEERNCSFKDAYEYVRDFTGIDKKIISFNSNEKHNADKISDGSRSLNAIDKEKQDKQDKIERIKILYDRSERISSNSIEGKYLKSRGINIDKSADLRRSGMFDKETCKTYPAILAFARDSESKITGLQAIYLHGNSYKKADIAVNKRSMGIIAGSFVSLNSFAKDVNNQTRPCMVTIIAEGVETGLSIKEALMDRRNVVKYSEKVNILCSLGVSNIKNYKPQIGERLIIAADHDGDTSKTVEIIERAKIDIEKRGAIIMVVRPDSASDFNDVLKNGGSREIADIIGKKLEEIRKIDFKDFIYEKAKSELEENLTNLTIENSKKEILGYFSIISRCNLEEAFGMIDRIGNIDKREIMKLTQFAVTNKIDRDLNLFDSSFNTEIAQIEGFREAIYSREQDGKLDYLNNIYKDKEIFDLVKEGLSKKRIERTGAISKIENSYIDRDLKEFGIEKSEASISEIEKREIIKYVNITKEDILSLCSKERMDTISITLDKRANYLKEYKEIGLADKDVGGLIRALNQFRNHQTGLCELYEEEKTGRMNNGSFRHGILDMLYDRGVEKLKYIDGVLYEDKNDEKYIEDMSKDLRNCEKFSGALEIINNKYIEISLMHHEKYKILDDESISKDIARVNIRMGKGLDDDTRLNDIFDKKSIEIMNQVNNQNQIDKMDKDVGKDIMKSCNKQLEILEKKLESMDKYEFSHRKEMAKEMESSKDLEELHKTIIKYEKIQAIEIEERIKQNLNIERSIFLNRDRGIDK